MGGRRLAGCFGVVLLLVFLDIATPAADTRDVVGATSSEGRVVVYSTMDSERFSVIQKTFEGRYGVPVDHWRASPPQVFDRVLIEARTGRVQYDVVILNGDLLRLLKRHGALAGYASRVYDEFPPASRDRDDILSPPVRITVLGVLYNTRLVPPTDLPKTLWDLLQPRWRDQIAIADPAANTTSAKWFMNLRRTMGARWGEFVEGLAAQRPALHDSFLTIPTKIIVGEQKLGITLLTYVHTMGRDGAPLDYVRMAPLLADVHYAALAKQAPHPLAGRLFLDSLLSRASLLALVQAGDFVALPGIYPPIKDADKLQIVMMEDATETELQRAQEELARIFHR